MLFCIMLPNVIQIGPLTAEIWCHIHFSKWRPLPPNTTSGFVLVDVTVLRRSKSISKPYFINISHYWRLSCKYFRFFENERPPYWNSISGFDIDHFAVICMLFCFRLPNFVEIRSRVAEVSRNIHFSRWRLLPLNTTSGFVFVDVTAFRRPKSISKQNFVDIHQFTAQIYLLRVLKNKRPP